MGPVTLPASWFVSKPLYELERRAVFHKAWHLLGPITRFVKRFEKVTYEIGQIKFFVINTAPEDAGFGVDGLAVYQYNDEGDLSNPEFATAVCLPSLSPYLHRYPS